MLDGMVSWLETELDQAAAFNPNPGRVDGLRRLSRTEYRNVIRDLLALEVDAADLLPADDSSGGFDNASLGGLDPGRLEAYLLAARKVSRLAVGAAVRPTSNTVVVPSDLSQDHHIAGLPFGTRGGVVVPYNFSRGCRVCHRHRHGARFPAAGFPRGWLGSPSRMTSL